MSQAKPTTIYVATPAYGCVVTVPYVASLVSLQGMCLQRGVGCMVDLVGNESLVSRARCVMCARFMATDATHLLWIDADIAFPAQAVLDRLLPYTEKNPDAIVCGVYAKKAYNYDRMAEAVRAGEPAISAGLDYNINVDAKKEKVSIEDGFVKVLDAATGFMMIPRGVIEKMNDRYRPTLHCKNDIPGSSGTTPEFTALYLPSICPDTQRYLSEDYAFVRRWQAMGGEVYADLTIPLAHYGQHTYAGDIRQRFVMTFVE